MVPFVNLKMSKDRSNHLSSFVILLITCFSCFAGADNRREIRDVRIMMGSRFELTVVAEDEALAREAIESAYQEIRRLEALISSWQEGSQTTEVNRQAGIQPVQVNDELFELTRRALKVSNWTNGAFDITFSSMYNVWNFKGENLSPPDPETIKRHLQYVDYQKVKIDPNKKTVFLPEKGMRIGFGAIGKGLAANGAARVLKEHGFKNGLVDAGGDLMAFGLDVTGQPWRIGIVHPRAEGKLIMELRLTDQAIVTSGDYERYFIYEGKRYGHIINPKTGWPVDHLRSVTVICPDAELADALATAVFVMGAEEGLATVNRLKGIEAIFIDNENRITVSNGIDQHIIKEFEP